MNILKVQKKFAILFASVFGFLIVIVGLGSICLIHPMPSWIKIRACDFAIDSRVILRGAETKYWRQYFERGVVKAETGLKDEALSDFNKAIMLATAHNGMPSNLENIDKTETRKYRRFIEMQSRINEEKKISFDTRNIWKIAVDNHIKNIDYNPR